MQASAPQRDLPLPVLREELQLSRGAPTLTGKPAWLIFDPVQHRYFELDHEAFQILSLWNAHKTSASLIKALDDEFGRTADTQRIAGIISFLQQNTLVLDDGEGAWKKHWRNYQKRQVSPVTWLIHNYLYIRIPLLRPSRFLKAALPYVAFVFTRTFVLLTVLSAMTGLFFASREWDTFISTFASFYSFEGIVFYGLVLVLIKIIHEMGHAFMATRFGCRVPTMGVAFLVMFPVLYTDVTDAWKLRSRRQRLLIGAAGMMAELALASYATLAWVFLPDGTAKSIAFVVATISWTMSIVINLNPLMRFDGYYLFSDATGIANLQSRGFAFGRWKLREILFDLRQPPPEPVPARTARIMYLYAWAVWIYRFFLFLGIALLVYAYFFKVLGIFLFAIEIVWFIARPVWSELKEWFSMPARVFLRPRTFITLGVTAGLAFLFFAPGMGRVDIPAIIEPASYERLFPVAPARLDRIFVKPGQHVKKGDLLFRFSSPALEQKRRLALIRLKLVEARIARASADRQDRSQMLTLLRERATLRETLAGINRETEKLEVRAPFDGALVDMNRKLHAGRWVKPAERLVTVVQNDAFVAKGYVAESDLWRIRKGDAGRFVPDNFMLSSPQVAIVSVATAGSRQLELPVLSSVYGGKIAARADKKGGHLPVSAVYRITMQVKSNSPGPDQFLRGVAHISGRPQSMASRVWRRVLQVLIRESGA